MPVPTTILSSPLTLTSSQPASVPFCAAPPAAASPRLSEPVLLSSKEYALLVALADRPGVVLSRGQLEEKLYNWDSTVGSNAIEVHVHHLRKKLSDGAIKTVRGVGYLLET